MIKRRTIAAITLALSSAGALAHSGAVISQQESGDNSYLASIVGSDGVSHQAQDIKALNQALSIRSQLKTQGVPIPGKLDVIIDQLAVKSACASTKGLRVCESLTTHDVINGVAAANLISGFAQAKINGAVEQDILEGRSPFNGLVKLKHYPANPVNVNDRPVFIKTPNNKVAGIVSFSQAQRQAQPFFQKTNLYLIGHADQSLIQADIYLKIAALNKKLKKLLPNLATYRLVRANSVDISHKDANKAANSSAYLVVKTNEYLFTNVLYRQLLQADSYVNALEHVQEQEMQVNQSKADSNV